MTPMADEEYDDEAPEPLSIGTIIDPTPDNRALDDAIRDLTFDIDDATPQAFVPPLYLNVVFQVPGRSFKPDFSGVRTGTYSSVNNELMVQVAVPEPIPDDPPAFLREATLAAIDESERWGRRRFEPGFDLSSLRKILG
jgi:hypothetical protein